MISFSFPKIVKVLTSEDGTQKFLIELADSRIVETVAIKEKGRLTLCLSSQIGCRQGCVFCVTGKIAFQRSLLHHEISDQLLVVSRFLNPQRVTHIVIMGMGEPFDNYSQVIQAVKTIIDESRGGISPRRITLSTAGIIPGIDGLGKERLGIKLAVSLNAPNDSIRNALMPVNRRYPLKDLLSSLRNYQYITGERITLEYCMIRGINDSLNCAMALLALLKGSKKGIKVNLIPYNCNPLLPFCETTEKSLRRFHIYLTGHGVLATVRKSKGADILAACGQLGYQGINMKKAESFQEKIKLKNEG